MKTSPLLAITCSAALIQGTASFTSSKSTAFTAGRSSHASKRRSHRGTAEMHMSTPLFGAPPFPRMTTHDDPLVNNRYSASDWLHNVFTLPRSSVLRDIRNPVVTIAVWSTLVSVFHRVIAKSSNHFLQKFASDICIGGAPHSFLVSSLGLLLVFRTNSAYQRFNVSNVCL